MKTHRLHAAMRALLPIAVLMLPLSWSSAVLAQSSSCTQGSTCVSVGGNNANDPLAKEEARQSKDQWDETQHLRKKVNNRKEKDFDKYDVAQDAKDQCLSSSNFNAYWEPNTERCLDRQSGHKINP
ncbi:DUF1283 family protein [Yersinia ruckeri]|uniref:DUF1283 family protein n=1 Tax=Yersinia ruckeri TaxID=29486 RepID=UPI001F247AAE|nr:DUF1283 family protein [Yersinia ruckeri]UIN02281.1 DUF1283 family protein [Yersinia ruckeri]